jgi:hypothetical protein
MCLTLFQLENRLCYRQNIRAKVSLTVIPKRLWNYSFVQNKGQQVPDPEIQIKIGRGGANSGSQDLRIARDAQRAERLE